MHPKQVLAKEWTLKRPSENNPTAEKINRFATLLQGWHYGEGGAIDEQVRDVAHRLLQDAIELGFKETDAFPGVNGEVALAIYHGQHYLEFTIDPRLAIMYYEEEAGEEVALEEELTVSQAREKLQEFGNIKCNSFDSSVQSITISVVEGSRVWRSSHQVKMQVYPSSAVNVSGTPALQSAPIYSVTTPVLQETRRFFGSSIPKPYL